MGGGLCSLSVSSSFSVICVQKDDHSSRFWREVTSSRRDQLAALGKDPFARNGRGYDTERPPCERQQITVGGHPTPPPRQRVVAPPDVGFVDVLTHQGRGRLRVAAGFHGRRTVKLAPDEVVDVEDGCFRAAEVERRRR